MEKYNYREVMKADIKEWLINNYDGEYNDYSFDYMLDHLYDDLWAEDEITGNGSNWYDSEHQCEEYICHNLDLLFEALYEFGELGTFLIEKVKKYHDEKSIARWADCTIRCYLLHECLAAVLHEILPNDEYMGGF